MYTYIYTRPHKLLSFNSYRVKIKVTYLLTLPATVYLIKWSATVYSLQLTNSLNSPENSLNSPENGISSTSPVALKIAKPMARPSLGWRQSSVFWRNQSGLEPTHTSPYSTIEIRPHKGWRPAQHNVWWAEGPKHSFLPLRAYYYPGP